jgi:hypothetical protein
MNRPERRAAASADKGFGGYRAQARRASPDISDRELDRAACELRGGNGHAASGARQCRRSGPGVTRARSGACRKATENMKMSKGKIVQAWQKQDRIARQRMLEQEGLIPLGDFAARDLSCAY